MSATKVVSLNLSPDIRLLSATKVVNLNLSPDIRLCQLQTYKGGESQFES